MSIDKSIRQHYDVPETKKIKGQLHKLAYITPEEAKLLQKSGGVETRTPEGISAYPGGAGTPGGYGGGAGFGGSGGGGMRDAIASRPHVDTSAARRADAARAAAAASAAEQARTDALNASRAKPDHLGDTGGSLKAPIEYITKKEPVIPKDEMIPGPLKQFLEEPKPIIPKDEMIPGPIKGVIDVPKIKEIVNLGDDAKAQHIQTIQQQAVVDWTNKTEREKDEHREKLQAAQEKLKTTKGGGFWKSLGNIALAMVLPALLPAKLAKGYNLYKTASNASAWAKRLNLTDRNIMQIVQQDIFKGVDIQKAIAGKETEFAKAAAKFSGQTDSNKEYTEDTIGKVKTARDIGDTITNEERQKYISQLDYVQGILQSGYYTDNEGRRYELTDDKRRQLSDYMNHLNTYLNPTTQGIAHGGLIDQPLTGRSRYI